MRFWSRWTTSPEKGRRSKEAENGAAQALFRRKYTSFKALLQTNSELLKRLSDLEEKLGGQEMFGLHYLYVQTESILELTDGMIDSFAELSAKPQPVLKEVFRRLHAQITESLQCRRPSAAADMVLPLGRVNREMIDWVGGKNANLGEIANRVGLPVPPGFAVTTAAYDRFMEANGLFKILSEIRLEPAAAADTHQIMAASEHLRSLFDAAQVPADLARALVNASRETSETRADGKPPHRLAVRSSAIGEDSDLSFAGQYLSVLNVSPEALMPTYKQILASLFSPRAISYRLQKGVPLESAAMAVVCLQMVPAKASGVMYTRHPFNILDNNILINAVWGLGTYVVEGVVSPDAYSLSKETPAQPLSVRIFRKTARLVNRPDGGVGEEPVERSQQSRACLTEAQMQTLAGYGLRLERHFQRPQDIEWALDSQDRLFILQSRPLRLGMAPPAQDQDNKSASAPAGIAGYTVLLSGGDTACPGVGCGIAHIVSRDEDLLTFPENGVLVAASSSPKFVMVMPKAQAIVTDAGSVTGHMASLTREFMVPALLNTQSATRSIRQGDLITVDAYSRNVYAGRVPELLEMRLVRGAFMKDTPVYQLLEKCSRWIVPLNLTNPSTAEFSAQGCRTIHDIMRFLHEKSYAEMFQISDLAAGRGQLAVKLEAPRIPLDLYLIDLGGGIRDLPIGMRRVDVNRIASIPFLALLRGLLREDLTDREPRPVSLGGFFSVVTRQMLSPPHPENERFGDKSYAIISDKYLNFSSRVGYHYSIIDAYCGRTESKNYINFEFKGGAADDVRKNRRVRAIAAILQSHGFFTDIVADRVTARIHKRSSAVIEEMLDQLGRLMLFTRQMDMLMHTDQAVDIMVQCFINGDYCFQSHVQ